MLSPRLFLFFFFFNDTATTEIYTLSLHDALPISPSAAWYSFSQSAYFFVNSASLMPFAGETRVTESPRSEEHTSELQSHLNLVCRLLLEKKKKMIIKTKRKRDTDSYPFTCCHSVQ